MNQPQESDNNVKEETTVNTNLVAYTKILDRPFAVGITKANEDFYCSGSVKFNGFKFKELIDECRFIPKDYNFIPECISELNFSNITVTVSIRIQKKSKENATEQDKTTEIKLELASNIGTVKVSIEKTSEDNKSFYWTLIYEPKKQDQQKDTDNDSKIQAITDNSRGIKVGELIDSFCKGVLDLVGYDKVSLPEFIKNFTITGFTATNKPKIESKQNNASQDKKTSKEKNIDIAIVTNLGSVEVQTKEVTNNEEQSQNEKTWSITYKNNTTVNILNIPVVGELVNKISSDVTTTITNLYVKASKINQNEYTLTLGCNALGDDSYNVAVPLSSKKPKQQPEQQSQPKQQPEQQSEQQPQQDKQSESAFHGTTVWKKFDKPKKILILTIPKIGLRLDNGHIAILLDASLNVSPLTFSLNEAGIGVNLSKLTDIKFYLSGFGVSFDNGVLSISGGCSVSYDEQNTPKYSGVLSIRFKQIGLTAIAQYTKIKIKQENLENEENPENETKQEKETAAFCACFALLAPIGGIPAFFVRGLAGGFGYNERLILPSIEDVNKYFLIKAAMDGFKENLNPQSILEEHVKAEEGQYFLAAGLKFTSFELIEGCMLITASFGKDFELGILGLANISIPPKIKNKATPIAYAQLALKATIKPTEGIFSVAAQLTNESYIFSKDCKLTGGFAACAWFGDNEHSGDFVVSLGGYSPSYQKPSHYPTVPRLGVNWKVDNNISISGEMYFAVTPSNLMAGGKLCATYSQGDLKAWFIAYADIWMNWKPFKYAAKIGATVGVSYTAHFWFVKKTFSIELSADLYIEGPEFHGTMEISWYIISFTISFGGKKIEDKLEWNDFVDTFLVSDKQSSSTNRENLGNDILSISLEGIIGNTQNDGKGIDIVSPYQIGISGISKIPMNKDNNGKDIAGVIVKPVEKIIIKPSIDIIVKKIQTKANSIEIYSNEKKGPFNKCEFIKRKLPSALWIPEHIKDVQSVNELCIGKKIALDTEKKLKEATNFPVCETLWISLIDLAEKNIIPRSESFLFTNNGAKTNIFEHLNNSANTKIDVQKCTCEDFQEIETNELANKRNKYINEYLNKYKEKDKPEIQEIIDIHNFVNDAKTLFSEDFIKVTEINIE